MASEKIVSRISIERGSYTIDEPVNHCARCGPRWEGKRRLVRDGDRLVCELCLNREREGLIFYTPSNGTEGDMFFDRCEECRHNIDDPDNPKPGSLTKPYQTCAWGISDRLYVQMIEGRDHGCMWFDPDDIEAGCPALCKRFTPKDYGFDDRDPPPLPCPGQMTFDDLNVPRELPSVEVANA